MYQAKHAKPQTKKRNDTGRDEKPRWLLPLYIVAGAVFLYAVVRLGAGFFNDVRNERDNDALREAVTATSAAPTTDVPEAEAAQPSNSSAPTSTPKPTSSSAPTSTPAPTPELAPISADFAALKSKNPDICAWLYSPDTHIDYPVVQGSDNAYYLTHTADNNYNDNGALFVDARGTEDFSSLVNVIYGHNLENQNMFGSLSDYYSQEYYQEHPVMYLLTPSGDYRLDVCCAFATYVTSPAFTFPVTEGSYGLLLKDIKNYNYLSPTVTAADGDRLVCMSTCTEADDQRFMVIAKMTLLG